MSAYKLFINLLYRCLKKEKVILESYKETIEFYEGAFENQGLDAQRRWPNEEFSRFMGRNYFRLNKAERLKTKILELGCATGANLRLLSAEGFDTYGIDLSQKAIDLVPSLIGEHDNLHVFAQDMLKMSFEENFFDAVFDIFSACCLDEKQFSTLVNDIYRILKVGGKFFCFVPSKGSDAFKNYKPANLIDSSTLDGIRRETSPYYGNFYPFRFDSIEDVYRYFGDKDKFEISYIEKTGRTYRYGCEYFEFLSYEVVKKG